MQSELFETGIRSQSRRPTAKLPAASPGYAHCEWCSVRFKIAKNRTSEGPNKQRFCSPECAHKWNHLLEDERIAKKKCLFCGTTFKPKYRGTNADLFCSKSCAQNGRRDKEGKIRKLIDVLSSIARRRHLCLICGIPSGIKQTCGIEHKLLYARQLSYEYSKSQKIIKSRICKECKTEFIPEYGNKKREFCTNRCMLIQVRRIAKSTRRARIKGVLYESFDPLYILKRAGWKCELCGIKTPHKLRGILDDRAPEVDHIIPLAKGGSHTAINTQCLCRKCNRDKSTRIMGQMRLCS